MHQPRQPDLPPEPEVTVPVDQSGDAPAAVAAATVVVARDGSAGLEVLLLQRHRDLSFAGGAWVFPGGRVDPADFGPDGPGHTGGPGDPGRRDGPGSPGLTDAERTAAIRECAEEAGIALDPATLHRWSHWTPPLRQGKRFSTAFFVAGAPDDLDGVTIDETEIVAHRWSAPAAALEDQAAGSLVLTPPTFITLVQLSQHTGLDDLLRAAPSRPVEHFTTRIAIEGDAVCALYHGDVAYESLDLSADGPRHRLQMAPGPWRYTRDPATLPG